MKKETEKTALRSDTSEKAIEKYLVMAVTRRGGVCLKYTNPWEVGYPDRLCLFPGGTTMWVEVKSRGEKPRAIQKVRIEMLQKMGFNVHCVDSKEEIDKILP